MMRIAIRTDASLQMGSGHVMRCLTLANELRQRGTEILFICREHPGNLIELIQGKGYRVARLPLADVGYSVTIDDVAHATWLGCSWQHDASEMIEVLGEIQPEWLIIDHYAIDYRWERKLRPHIGNIMVIDDLADRRHDCDVLLDQNLYQSMGTRYNNLVPGACRKLLGPKYALLRPEFAAARNNLRPRDGQVKRVLVFFGGVDPTNETVKILRALSIIEDRQFEVDVVVGVGNIQKELIRNFCVAHDGFNYHCQVDNMAELMAAADLAIGAGGSTTWERCYLALPSITIVIAENQRETTAAVAATGATLNIGWYEDVSAEAFTTAFTTLLADATALREMGRQALNLIGDRSGAWEMLLLEPSGRIAIQNNKDFRLRPVAEADLETVLQWRNSERIRTNMYTDHIITMEEHRAWFELLPQKKTEVYLVFELFQKPVGLTYFTNIDQKNGKCFWGFYLGEENLPHGTGTKMGILGLEYAFEKLHIRKLCGEVFQFNTASIRFFQRFGFVEEGHFVEHMLKNGKYEDVLSFALFSEDWLSSKANLAEKILGKKGGML